MMKLAQLVVTAVFAFLGGMTFQLLDGSTIAQAKGDKQDATHMKELKVDSLSVKELRVYDADWKVRRGEWTKDGVLLFGEDGAAAVLAPSIISVRSKGEASQSFDVTVDVKEGVLVALNGADGKFRGKWTSEGIVVFGEDKARASIAPTSIILNVNGKSGPSFVASVDHEAGSSVHLFGPNGKTGASLGSGVSNTNSAHVDIHDSDGAERASMAFNDNGKPFVRTYDGAGRVVDNIGGK